jgi:hypothetical protein
MLLGLKMVASAKNQTALGEAGSNITHVVNVIFGKSV